MKATADLRAEHVGVGRMLRIMDAMARRIHMGETVEADDLAQSLDFLRVFVDRCHHGKEEELLFAAMREHEVPGVELVIEQLLDQHEAGRATVRRIAAAVESRADNARAELAGGLVAYVALLREHITLEERFCFNPADRELSGVVQNQLAEGYERMEKERVGPGKHEAFHGLLDRLESAYSS